MWWDNKDDIGEWEWMGPKIESVEKVLWMMIGVGPLPRLT